jgi:hypothetical protein
MESTTIERSGPPVAGSAAGRRGRWQSSSRANPCPVCGRDSDDKCRWGDDQIHCYPGSRFAPPDVRPGEVITLADGSQWFRCRRDGGFSGGHAVFRPHRPLEQSRPRTVMKRQTINPADALAEAKRVRTAVRVALEFPDFEFCSTDQLRQHGRQLVEVAKRISRLRETLRNVRKPSVGIDALRRSIEDWERQIEHQQRDLQAFQRDQLGEAAVVELQP